jgi:hypothetical protein
MSESAIAQQKPALRSNTSDQQVLAQVEKWMAVIREISGERGGQNKLPR